MRSILVTLCCLLFSGALFAQTGSITGEVRDPADALVANASITITNTATGVESTTRSTGTGGYTVPALQVGEYKLAVEAPGFKKWTQDKIQLQVATTVRVDVVLQVGSASESVTVTADVVLLKSETAEQSTVVASQTINELPLNYGGGAGSTGNIRSPFAFNVLSPGILGTGSDGGVVNGLPANTFRMQVDGQDATSQNDPAWTSTVAAPSVDMIQEFSIQTSNYAAEYGQAGGGFYNFSMKSGTNQYHGSAFEYWTNEDLNAARYGGISVRSRKNDFGGTVGGPIWIPKIYNGKNKSFFFFNWESYRNKVYQVGTFLTVPTARMRAGDFSYALTGKQLGNDINGTAIVENAIYDPASNFTVGGQVVRRMFSGNIIPQSRLDPIALKFQNLFPVAARTALTNNFDQNFLNPRYQKLPAFKLDQVFPDSSRLSLYVSLENTDQLTSPEGLPQPISAVRVQAIYGDTSRLNYDKSFTPTLLAHLGIGFSRFHNPDSSPPESLTYDTAGQLGFVGSATTPGGFPKMTGLSGPLGTGMPGLGPNNANSYFDDTLTAPLSATLVHGNHTFKAGGEFRLSSWSDRNSRGAQGILNFSGNETALPYLNSATVTSGQNSTAANGSGTNSGNIGVGYASFLLGQIDSASVNAVQDPQLRKKAFGFFVQDTWKVTRKLTLDYGLRWDIEGQGHEIHYRTSEFGFKTPDANVNGLLGGLIYEGYGAGRCNCQFTKTYMYALGPRLGLAYSLDKKTVIRAGIGVSYGTPPSYAYITNANVQGVGFNSVSFNNSGTGGFGFPAVTLGSGLQYNHASLTDASLNPALLTPLSQADIAAGRTQATALGSFSTFWLDPNVKPARVLAWSVGVQREVIKSVVVEASWVANVGVWESSDTLNAFNLVRPATFAKYRIDPTTLAGMNTLNATMSSTLGKASGVPLPYPSFPTGSTVLQALRPFPQINGNFNSRWAPLGKSWYESLQVKVTKRYTNGFSVQSAYTWGKAETNPSNNNDLFNRANHKALQGSDIPMAFNTGFSYELPKFTTNKWVRSAIGGWTVSGLLQYQSGSLIGVPGSSNGSIGGQGSSENRVPGVPLFLKPLNGNGFDPNKDFVLNPAAWANPALGQFGTAAPFYTDYRNERHPTENLTFGRRFTLSERRVFEIRAEFFNALNRFIMPGATTGNPQGTRTCTVAGVGGAAATTYTVDPTTNSCAAGTSLSGFGRIDPTTANGPRNGQIVARFTF